MKGNWEKRTFRDAPIEIIDGDRGKEYPKHSDFADSGYCLFLDAGNVTSEGFEFSECQFISEEKDAALRKGRVNRQDIVLTTRGTVGNVAYYNDDVPFDRMRINSGMVILRASADQLVPSFLYCFLRSPLFKGQAHSLISGVAQPQLPIRDMNLIKLPLPTLPLQKSIASTVSAYDDLIQNNQRRIKLLEESARLLYEEWFVRLRFPGHEHRRIVKGVPEGWEKKSLGQVIELKYGKSLKEENRVDGPHPVYGSSGIVGTHDEFLVKGPGIIVGRKGNVGSVYWSHTDFFPIDTVYYVDSTQSDYFMYHNLQHQSFQSSHGAVPGLSRERAYSQPILIPRKTIRGQFEETATPVYEQIFTLKTMNQKLQQARDILLPKLMSGEIGV